MIDFTENIESLESMVWNFILNPISEDDSAIPSNGDYLSKDELMTLISHGYFNDDTRNEVYKYASKFFKRYSKIPNKKELSSFLEVNNVFLDVDDFENLYMFNLRDYNFDYLYTYVKSFILLKNLNITLFDMLAYLKTAKVSPKNIDNITDKIRNDINNKLSISFNNTSKGLNFFDTDSHIQIPKIGTPTGFTFFDKTQGGGWNLKTLVVLQGRPKVGKSMVLGNIAARSFLIGNNTGLVTVELADRSYMKRIGSNILSITKDDYEQINDIESASMVKKKLTDLSSSGKQLGELEIVEFPTGSATAIDIENYFIRLENKKNKKFNVIVVDYLNLLKPIDNNGAGLYEKVKAICEDLRGVAMRNEWCIISATQIRREDVENFDLGMDSVAESFGLVHTVDALYGLMRSPLEGRMKIKLIANRDNGYEESYKFFKMEKDYFRLTEEHGMNTEYYSDDEDGSNLETQVREEYNNNVDVTPNLDFNKTDDPAPVLDTSNVDNLSDDDYDALFDSI